MRHLSLPSARPGPGSLSSQMFANLDCGIPVRGVQRRPLMAVSGSNPFLGAEHEGAQLSPRPARHRRP